MDNFAMYRLPYESRCTLIRQTEGTPMELESSAELTGKKGFVIAPFAVSPSHPLLLLRPDVIEHFDVAALSPFLSPLKNRMQKSPLTPDEERMHYKIDFANFHSHLLTGEFRKIVLARCAYMESDERLVPESLFRRACELFPRLFVALMSTQKNGMWLVATPEILIDGGKEGWHTMALAGTMKLNGENLRFDNPPHRDMHAVTPQKEQTPMPWSRKNMEEQRYVSTYITECIEHFSNNITATEPYTVRAGDLVHLRTDFNFTLDDGKTIGELISELHPTPAVCGLPKRSTFDFIVHNEYAPRAYYSGFSGPIDMDGKTHLYVSLRCMRLVRNGYKLYAGGGLLKDSDEQQEWEETEAKLETMKKCLAIKKI
jgi:isochorismate synthase